jgi:putative hydrolase of the HAD superfamily
VAIERSDVALRRSRFPEPVVAVDLGGIELFVFDIDDTVFLERDYVQSGFDAVGGWMSCRFGTVGFGEVCWQMFIAGVRGNTFERALDELGVADAGSLGAELVGVYRRHTPSIALLPDAATILQSLPRDRVAVITDGPVASQRKKFHALGLDQYAGLVIVTGEMGDGFGKPDQRSFRMAEKWSGVAGSRCVYFGDNPDKDLQGPEQLG